MAVNQAAQGEIEAVKTTLGHYPGHTPAEQPWAGDSAFSEPHFPYVVCQVNNDCGCFKGHTVGTLLIWVQWGGHHSGEMVVETRGRWSRRATVRKREDEDAARLTLLFTQGPQSTALPTSGWVFLLPLASS